MPRPHGIHSVDMKAGHGARSPGSWMSRVTGHPESLDSPEISDALKNALRSLLRTRRRSLLDRLHSVAMPLDPAAGWGDADALSTVDEAAGEKAMIPVLRINRKLQQVEDALERIGQNGFGSCVYCRGPVEKARLESDPTARSCRRCHDRLVFPPLPSGSK